MLGHVYDRWSVAPGVTVDAGLFPSIYVTTVKLRTRGTFLGASESTIDRDTSTLNPRVGVAVDVLKNMTIRAAYQKRSTPRFDGELAPVDTVGLIPPTFDIAFSHADDLEGSVELELTKDTFLHGLIGYQWLSDISTLGDNKKARLVYGRAALNRILGQYFSFSIRYHYNNSRYLDGSGRILPGVPRDSGDARFYFIHPCGIQLGVVESYNGKMFLDDSNKLHQGGYFKTDLFAQMELFQKHLFLSAAIQNVFDKPYLTLASPVIHYGGIALPARGRTFSLRGEYRF